MKSILFTLSFLGSGLTQGITTENQDPNLISYLKGYAQLAGQSCTGDLTAEKVVNPGF